MLRWFFLFVFIGCIVNAANFSKKSLDDNEEEDFDFYSEISSIHSIETENEEDWNLKERLWWLIGAIASIILFFWL